MTDSTNWGSLNKPWTIEQCRDRYVMGDRIGLRSLAELAGISYDTIRYSSRNQGWVEQRSQFKGDTSEKTIDIISAQIAGKTAEIFQGHYDAESQAFKAAQLSIDMVTFQIKSVIERFEQIKKDPSCDDDKSSGKRAYEMQALTSSLNQAQTALCGAIDAQRKALGLDYADINYAVASVRRSGLEVVGKKDFELYKKYVAGQTPEQDSDNPNAPAVIVSTLEVVPSSESANS